MEGGLLASLSPQRMPKPTPTIRRELGVFVHYIHRIYNINTRTTLAYGP